MGISLTDLGSFATGAIDRDRELTSEKFKIRAEELKANRDFVIAQKQKKYESEIKSFEDEQKKYKAIQSVNAKYEGQDNVGKAAWAKDYLFEYKPEQYNAIVKQADGDMELMNSLFSEQASKNLVTYKTSTTRDAIDDNIRSEVESITADYNNRLENAKGDSFLISKLIGDKNKKIAKVTKEVNEGAKGVEISKSITEETQPVKTSESKMPFTFSEESTVATFKPPKKFITEGKIEEKRTKLNNSDNQKSFSKASVNSALSFFKNNEISKPQVFYKKNQQTGEVTNFTGAGAVLNEHLGMLHGGAVDSFTDEKIYLMTNKRASYTSSIFNDSTVKNVINERVNDYTYIEQPKTWFKDRESIVGIVPFSVVGVDNTIDGTALTSTADKKLVGKLYVDALKVYTEFANKNSNGEILMSNQKFMNDTQSKLLALRGNESPTSKFISEYIVSKLPKVENTKVNNINTDTPSIIINGQSIPLTDKNKKYLDSINVDYSNSEIKSPPKKDIETPIEDIDVLSEGQSFTKKETKPVSSMSFEERRAFEKERSDERKRKIEERNKSFNEKIKKNNEQVKNNKSLTSVKANIPDVDADV